MLKFNTSLLIYSWILLLHGVIGGMAVIANIVAKALAKEVVPRVPAMLTGQCATSSLTVTTT